MWVLKVEHIKLALPMMLEADFVSRTLLTFHCLRSVHININKRKRIQNRTFQYRTYGQIEGVLELYIHAVLGWERHATYD